VFLCKQIDYLYNTFAKKLIRKGARVEWS